MSILITGANGAVGKDLVQILSKEHKILGFYRTKNIGIKKTKNVKWVKHNLIRKIRNISPKPKYIIHCAVDQKYKDKNSEKYIRSNLKVLENIIDFAEKSKVKLIINFSSVEVYGKNKKPILDEKCIPQNLNTYGFLKLISERYLFNKKINFINIRLPGIICNENIELNRPWLNTIFNNMNKNKSILVHNINNKFNNLITTHQIAKLTNFLINKKIIIRDTFNFACRKPLIMNNILSYLKKELKSKSKIIKISGEKKSSFYISTKKLQNKLNFNPETTKNALDRHLKNFLV